MDIPGTRIPASGQEEFYAAIKNLLRAKKRPISNSCLWGGAETGCAAIPIASHLISESWLRRISDTQQHVIQFEVQTASIANNGARIQARRIGVGQKSAVTFPGFCQHHDSTLFRCLEKEEFIGNREQLLALTYQSTSHEFTRKYQLIESILSGTSEALENPLARLVSMEVKNCYHLLAWKLELEEMLLNGGGEIEAYIIECQYCPEIVVSVTFSSPFTITGKTLEPRLEFITLSVFPSGNSGFAVFTWNKHKRKNPSLFIKPFINLNHNLISTAILYLILEVSENFCIAPSWWNGLSDKIQDDLKYRYARSLVSANSTSLCTSIVPRSSLVNWGIVKSQYA